MASKSSQMHQEILKALGADKEGEEIEMKTVMLTRWNCNKSV